MLKKEYDLILTACLRNRTDSEEEKLNGLVSEEMDWGLVGGELVHHRLGGYFYSGLSQDQRQYLFPEFLKALDLLVRAQRQQTLEVNQALLPILNRLEEEGIRYAALKGAVFNASIYALGERRSNDSDILVLEDDLDKLDIILREAGYIQSMMHNGQLVEATRREKMIQRMNHHDLVPYVRALDGAFLDKHEIDINFHFDNKENDITRKVFDQGTFVYEGVHYTIRGLPWETHLAHLCVHFHREGSSSIWSSGRRDVVLYKIIDIANTIRLSYTDPAKNMDEWADTMIQLNLTKEAYYTLHHIQSFYKDLVPADLVATLMPEDTRYVQEIEISGERRYEQRKTSFYDDAFNLFFQTKPNKG
ncbi:nucleotidyltransferase family protein [Paenibacillus kobensis]|uniref:nucleotidyltransferase family protein n=1 Tax=Paenibacillus kobensis TaxID=59841 RepID=UPI000FD7EB27|nr:nucleotidyltransferase family protein [Paenibacillus kobensis]